jgi:hypothetical protein
MWGHYSQQLLVYTCVELCNGLCFNAIADGCPVVCIIQTFAQHVFAPGALQWVYVGPIWICTLYIAAVLVVRCLLQVPCMVKWNEQFVVPRVAACT